MRSRLAITLMLLAAVLGLALSVAAAQETVEYTGPELTAGGPEGPKDVVPVALSLEQAIGIAIQYNPQVAGSSENVNTSSALVMQALSLLYPRLDVQTTRVTPVHLPPFTFQSPESYWETAISFQQPLYTAGALRSGLRAARDLLKGSEGSYHRTRQEVAYSVRNAYYGVLTGEEQVKVAQEVLNYAVETLRVARLRYDAGVAPQFDVLSAEANVARIQQSLISAQVQRDTAWAILSTALGVPIPTGTQLSTPRPVSVETQNPEGLRTEGLANRPDLLAVEADVSASRARLSIARAARQPTISAGVNYLLQPSTTISGDVFGQPGTDIVVSQNTGQITVTAAWTLFDAGQVTGEIREAQARLRQSEDAVTALRQQVELEIRSADLALAAASAQVDAARKEVDQQQEAFRIATIRYQEGVGTSVEILSAEADLGGAKTRLNQAVFELNLAVAQLDLALGRPAVPGQAPSSTEEPVG
jgi:outer membrane protein